MSQPRLRKPRFSRSPDSPRLCITERDVRILDIAERHRFIRSDQLRAVVGGSAQHFTRRIGRLYHAGFLGRPRAQIILHQRANTHFIYHVTARGQSVLRDRGLATFASPPRSRGETMALSLTHAVRVADVMLALQRAASADGTAFVPHEDWTKTEEPRLTQMRWSVRISYDGKSIRTSVVPDGTFALEHYGKRSCFFLEVDRGTMPATRSNSEQTSFRRKVLAYKATRDAGILWKRYATPGFRVLVVAESERRLRSLRAATASCFQRGESAMFCFAVTGQLIGAANVFDHAWLSPGGAELRPLAPSP